MMSMTHGFLRWKRHEFDELAGSAVSTSHAAIHIALILCAARVLAGKLQAAAKSWFRRLVKHRGVLPDFGAGVAAEGVAIVAVPEH